MVLGGIIATFLRIKEGNNKAGPMHACSTEPHPLHCRAATSSRDGYPGILDARDTIIIYIT